MHHIKHQEQRVSSPYWRLTLNTQSYKNSKVGKSKNIKKLYLKPKGCLRGVILHYHDFQKKEMSNQQCKAKFKLEQHNVHNVKIQGVTTFALNPTNA